MSISFPASACAGAACTTGADGFVGLPAGTEYTCTVAGTSSVGVGLTSAPSNSFTTLALTWTVGNAAVGGWGICWSSALAKFITVAQTATSGNQASYSSDGITWNNVVTPAGGWSTVACSSQVCVAGAMFGTGADARVMSSNDGQTWAALSPAPPDIGYAAIVWSEDKGLFVGVGISAPYVATSTDGVTWVAGTAPNANHWRAVTYSPDLGLFVAVSETYTTQPVMVSSDGFTWEARTAPETAAWKSVVWSAELSKFCAVGSPWAGQTQGAMTSVDGMSWVSHEASGATAGAWGPATGNFVGVRSGQTTTYSADGINWALSASFGGFGNWVNVAFSPTLGIFVAISDAGVNNRVITT